MRIRNLEDIDNIVSSILVFDYEFLQAHPDLFESYAHIYHNEKEVAVRPIASWIPPQYLPEHVTKKFSAVQTVQGEQPDIFFEEENNSQVDVDEFDIEDLLKSPAHFFPNKTFEDSYVVFPPGSVPHGPFEIDTPFESHKKSHKKDSKTPLPAEHKSSKRKNSITDEEKLLKKYEKPLSRRPVNVCSSCTGKK